MIDPDKEIEAMFAARKPRIDTVVLTKDGKTEFVPRSDMIDWQRKNREEAIRSGAVFAGVVATVFSWACLLTGTGNVYGCFAVIGIISMLFGFAGLAKYVSGRRKYVVTH